MKMRKARKQFRIGSYCTGPWFGVAGWKVRNWQYGFCRRVK